MSTNEQALALMQAWASDEAETVADIREIAHGLRNFALRNAGRFDPRVVLARKVQAYVQECVAFHSEPGEVSRRADVTLRTGKGDCDDHAVLVAALDIAAELDGRVLGLRDLDGEIVHATTAVYLDGWPIWQETTVGATLGESPGDAAARTMAQRPDIPR